MSNQSLGITATELFACNPYRILGIAVNSTQQQIDDTYKKLLTIASAGRQDSYTTAFDFPSLPPFTRDEKTLKTAYAKLASNGYRCFAYADSEFSQALNTDDVMLNIRDITCYDCFLRCYMWLITNDREFEEPELWVPLCEYIDKMIKSSPNEWERYFDNRFPQSPSDSEQYKADMLRSFYETFRDIILLPIKEMVRGSMRCKTAIDILKAAKVDVTEQFPYVDIPQANLPKPGQPASKLKIAVKDGEEYYEVSSGKMVNFASENDSEVESNNFETARAISADAIVGNDDETAEQENVNNSASYARSDPFAGGFVQQSVQQQTVQQPVQQQPVQQQTSFAGSSQPQGAFDPFAQAAESYAKESQPQQPKAAVVRRPKPQLPGVENKSPSPQQPVSQQQAASSVQTAQQPVQQSSPQTPKVSYTAPTSAQPQPTDINSQSKKPYKKSAKGLTLTSIIDEVDKQTNKTTEVLLTEEENEENLYTDALIKMLRSNRSSKLMKDVDTRHVFDNGDTSEKKEKQNQPSMDAINMKKLDKSLLNSAYDGSKNLENMDPKQAMAEKYKNINVNDMINPKVGQKLSSEFKPDAIEEYKKQKQQDKAIYKSVLKLSLILFVILGVLLVFFYFGIL